MENHKKICNGGRVKSIAELDTHKLERTRIWKRKHKSNK